MKTAPVIIVQLIHIEGPFKGQILELSDPEIKIGRHSSCQLQFPADFNIISREHATILREGNRFKLTDHSANGTIVNGKRISETFLKDGDVITVSEGGPKVSFLTRMEENIPVPEPDVEPPASQPEEVSPPPVETPAPEPPPQPAPISSQTVGPPSKSMEPLILQYGPTLRTFERLPVKVGRHPNNDFQLDHPAILDFHAEIYYADGQFWIKDLTGRQMISINGIPADQGASLKANDELSLSASGPYFQFLGNGRLAELEKTPIDTSFEEKKENEAKETQPMQEKGVSKSISFLKKFLSK